MNAVIVDVKSKYAAAMTEDGSVCRIADRGYEPGQTINLAGAKVIRFPGLAKRIAAAAAAFFVVLGGGAGTAYAMPYGTVSIEVNPVLEYTINCFDMVLSVRAENEEGEAILKELDVKTLRHRSVDEAVGLTMQQIEKDGYLSLRGAGVRIEADTRNGSHTDRLQQRLDRAVHEEMGFPEKPPRQ